MDGHDYMKNFPFHHIPIEEMLRVSLQGDEEAIAEFRNEIQAIN